MNLLHYGSSSLWFGAGKVSFQKIQSIFDPAAPGSNLGTPEIFYLSH